MITSTYLKRTVYELLDFARKNLRKSFTGFAFVGQKGYTSILA